MGLRRLAALVLVMGFAFVGFACPDSEEPEGVCGNGLRESGEACDDGNLVAGDGCSPTCMNEAWCGDGSKQAGEECDDGNNDSGDGCDGQCRVEVGCGDGVLQVGEQCDDNNVESGDGCSATCIDEDGTPTCGNAIWEFGEGCEDGNTEDGDGCSSTCVREDGCGNGTQEGTEGCDDGNNVSGDGCSSDCAMEFFCGDAVCDTAHAESCERCPADCCPDCGDGVLGGIEQCDDGNNVAGDGCSPGCIDEDGTPECGNGLWELGETCDDGNTDDADGCSASCQVEFDCGDGVCDAANHETCLLCAQDCCPDCGNGVIDPGEQCDETAFGPHTCESLCFGSGTLACNAGCQLDTSACVALPDVCGDHTVACGEACDLENLDGQTCQSLGFASGTLACDTSCGFDLAGCSDRRFYLSETFEGGAVPAGWSTSGLWEVGTPTGPGPGAAHGGTACAGTKLDGDYAQPCAYLADWLQTPVIDLSAATAPRLLFRLWIDAAAGTDGANLWFSLDGGLSFQPLPASTILFPAYDGAAVGGHPAWSSRQASRGWQPVLVDLAPFAGSRLVLRFAFRADGSDNAYPGAYVDDVLVAEAARIPVEITTRDPLPSAATGHAYAAPLEAFGGAGGYVWTVVDGSNIDWIERDAGTGEIAGGVLTGTPDASDVGPAWITIRAEAQGDAANANERTFDLEVVQALCFTDFEGALPAGWTLPQAMPPMIPAVWEWGTPSVVGPAACHSGTGCLGTVMAANYPTATCLATLCAAASPPIDLSTSTAPVLTYWQWIDFAAVDGGYLGIDGEVVTAVDPPYNGSVTDMLGTVTPVWIGDLSNLGWHRVTVDLTPYAGSSIQVSFAIANATASTDPGWYVDDFMVID